MPVHQTMLQKNDGTFLLLVLLLLALHEYEPIKYKEAVVSIVEETRKYILKMFSLIKVLYLFIKQKKLKKRFGIRVDYPFCYSSCFTLNTMSTMNAENIEASCSAHHLPVMLPHQSVYASEDVVSLASATHGILFSIPLLLNSQLSNFLISSTAVCLLSVATNEYDL